MEEKEEVEDYNEEDADEDYVSNDVYEGENLKVDSTVFDRMDRVAEAAKAYQVKCGLLD